MPSREFEGTKRFAVRRRLGSGGMGVVYHAYDRVRGTDVALKTLRRLEPEAIYRLKKEFRALADVSHPNLVCLYELFHEQDVWFYTMELVRGLPFIEYVRTPFGTSSASFDPSQSTPAVFPTALFGEELTETTTQADSLVSSTAATTEVELGGSPSILDGRSPANPAKLRPALAQLCLGLGALHARGKLHRDLKPSNILVTPAGRVVILDFGLVAELVDERSRSSSEHGGLAGTFAYMAPEAGGHGLLPASDWYSVGVLVYEALTGRLPFVGGGIDVLLSKQRERPAPPRAIAHEAPRDLDALAMALLRIEPEARPKYPEIMRRLGAHRVLREPSQTGSLPVPSAAPFIGRNAQLAALDAAFSATRAGFSMVVAVRGDSGVGKSALARRFLSDLKGQDVLVLSGRCYERETLPYKALDSLVDALARHLGRLSNAEILPILPRAIRALARLFPVLDRVEAISQAPRLPAQTPDPQELKRRAFESLRALFVGLSERTPIVLYIDDLQWGDTESLEQILGLLRPPSPPPVLFLCCYRAEDEATSPVLRALLRARSKGAPVIRNLSIGALNRDEARDLALTLLGPGEEASFALADSIAQEAQGNPFFVDALVRYSIRQSEQDAGLSLDDALRDRFQRLPPDAWRVLSAVCTAGRPVRLDVAAKVAAAKANSELEILESLRSGHLIRTIAGMDGGRARSGALLIEPYHDRVRDAVQRSLTEAESQQIHERLALQLEQSSPNELDAIFAHYKAAQRLERAAEYAVRAADTAYHALAFGRAAEMYRTALKLGRFEPSTQHSLLRRLGDALAGAGRGSEAARAYLEASSLAEEPESSVLRRSAAQQYLISGHIDQGLKILERVLSDHGLKLATSPARAYTSRMFRSAQLWRRGLEFKARPADQIRPEQLHKVDLLWAASTGLAMVDYMRSADCQGRHLLAALKCGDPYRFARAASLEAWYTAGGGGKTRARADELVEATQSLAEQIGDPHALGLAMLSKGLVAHLCGAWSEARPALERSEAIFRERCNGAFWEVGTARLFLHGTLFHLGELGRLSRRVTALIDEAEARGDLLEGTSHRIGHSNAVWLAFDNPERAARFVDEALGRWSHRDYHLQHFLALIARVNIALYSSRRDEPYELIEADWARLDDSLLLKVQYLRVEAYFARARALIAAAASSGSPEKLLTLAEADAERIDGERMPWTGAVAAALRGDLSLARGKTEPALREWTEAQGLLHSQGMRCLERAVRLRLGELKKDLGEDDGTRLFDEAFQEMLSEEIRNPLQFARMLLP